MTHLEGDKAFLNIQFWESIIASIPGKPKAPLLWEGLEEAFRTVHTATGFHHSGFVRLW